MAVVGRADCADVAFGLNHLAVEREVAPSTAKQALSALLFLYREVYDQKLPWLDGITRAKRPQRLPVVLAVPATQALLAHCTGLPGLICRLLYGTGMRVNEGLRLRVGDIDIARGIITVRQGKGGKDRTTCLPRSLVPALEQHLTTHSTSRSSPWPAPGGRRLAPT